MSQFLDVDQSADLAQKVKSKAKTPFENAYRAALATPGATYVQGFLTIAAQPPQLLEHSWLELGDRILDPTFPYFQKSVEQVYYFPAQRLSVSELTAAVEEAQEDYPDDPPLPVYGKQPYEYYGDEMLGGKEYFDAYEAAVARSNELLGNAN